MSTRAPPRPAAQARGDAPPLPQISKLSNAEMVLAIARACGVQFALLKEEIWVRLDRRSRQVQCGK
jgi:hypothetical protein